MMRDEIDVMQVEKRIRNRVKRQMEKSQRDYYLNEQIKAIQKELGDGDDGGNEITKQLDDLAKAAELTLLADDGLLDEVSGLVEWPHAIMGQIDDDYMTLPKDILVLTMRSHQKYFALTHADGRLAPAFITISNMQGDKTRDAMIDLGAGIGFRF